MEGERDLRYPVVLDVYHARHGHLNAPKHGHHLQNLVVKARCLKCLRKRKHYYSTIKPWWFSNREILISIHMFVYRNKEFLSTGTYIIFLCSTPEICSSHIAKHNRKIHMLNKLIKSCCFDLLR